MRKAGILAALALAGCTGAAPPTPSAGTEHVAVYDCGFDAKAPPVVADFRDGEASLTLPDGTHRLQQALAASGARYVDGAVTFWIKGREATLETPSGQHHCIVTSATPP